MEKTKGFTLIELLVVIAIIGILSTVMVVNFSGSRQKATDTSAYSSVSEAVKAAIACNVDGGTVNTSGAICTDSIVATGSWPDTTKYTGWGALTVTISATGGQFQSASAANGSKSISCSSGGCTKTGF